MHVKIMRFKLYDYPPIAISVTFLMYKTFNIYESSNNTVYFPVSVSEDAVCSLD